ncbi:hypothetical protein KSF_021920 [Reticulibacter mediterranei]|uniref:Cobalt ECF transporter T component CbiQ n=1 Tax=Reticulibacter mediterranei TaxID=2778369 RepID=A0A8J3IB38_9CHLR|nr:energy-coupling factor transporter transmembrane component T [Reticulibacter mediterranei]GHO92144.1 hypothetical protein KSF_021920 [Reticulibacter mediterranei]
MQTFYYETDSLLHRLNPLSKVLALMPALIFVALTTDPWTPVAFIGFIAILLLTIGKVPLIRLARIAGPILLMMISFGLIYPFAARADLVSNSPVLLHLGPLTVYQAGVINGLIVILRTCALLSLSLLFTLTTDTSDFIRAMVQQWKLPYKLGYGALAAFRFLPMLQAEMQLIQAAHKVRGIADRGAFAFIMIACGAMQSHFWQRQFGAQSEPRWQWMGERLASFPHALTTNSSASLCPTICSSRASGCSIS